MVICVPDEHIKITCALITAAAVKIVLCAIQILLWLRWMMYYFEKLIYEQVIILRVKDYNVNSAQFCFTWTKTTL